MLPLPEYTVVKQIMAQREAEAAQARMLKAAKAAARQDSPSPWATISARWKTLQARFGPKPAPIESCTCVCCTPLPA